MTNALLFTCLFSGIIYGIAIDGTFWYIYSILVALYSIYVLIQKDIKENPRRKTILISTWDQPDDPSAYVYNDYNMDKAIAYLEKLNENSDLRITMTHLVGYASAWGAYKMRRDVGKLPWGSFRRSKKIGITVLVDVGMGEDLVPVTIHDGHTLTL